MARPQVSVELDRSGTPAPEAACGHAPRHVRGCRAAGGCVSHLSNTCERPDFLHSRVGPRLRGDSALAPGPRPRYSYERMKEGAMQHDDGPDGHRDPHRDATREAL